MIYDLYHCDAWVPDANPEAAAKGCGGYVMEKIPSDSHKTARGVFCKKYPTVNPDNVKVRRWDEKPQGDETNA